MTLSRRSLITGLAALVAAPAIVRVNHLMPISVWEDGVALQAASHPLRCFVDPTWWTGGSDRDWSAPFGYNFRTIAEALDFLKSRPGEIHVLNGPHYIDGLRFQKNQSLTFCKDAVGVISSCSFEL